MDSFSFPFERMSGMDMHPLSFPISRLSPAKSSSSIDQYTHHHGKGDSAYSSFSGGSNAPDLSSPFFPDDLHAHSLHYADFKYMNSALSFGAESEPKSMDQLYRSMEALTRQCDQGSDNCSNSNQQCGKKQTSPSASASAPPSAPAPPPPARLESLVTFRNMENLWARQSPEGQTADRSHQKTRLMPAPPSPPPFASNSSCGPDTVYSLLDSQHCVSVNQDASALPKSANMLSRSTQMYPSAATEHDGQKGSVAQGEVLRKRACSVHTSPPAAFVRPADSWQQSSSLPSSSPINGSIQHKGHFYFVTGVCKTEESMPVANISENSCVDVHKSVEKERVHGQVGGVQRTANQRHNSYEREYFPHAQELSVRRQDADGYLLDNALLGSTQALHVSDVLEPGQRLLGREITSRHHSPAHPIFYCGPEESMPQVQPTGQMNSIASPVTDPTIHIEKQEEQVRKVRKQPLDGVPREKINKETTPLLYHLTGANQMALMKKFKNYSDSTTTCKNSEWNSVALQHPEKEQSNSKEVNGTNICSDQCEEVKMPVDAKIDSFSYPYNTLDDSYKKYYKEKLKDVQSQVLRMTSFKRKDLQPYKIKQSHEQQQPLLQVFPSAQDPLYTTDKPSHPWPQHQFQVSDTKSRTESPTERTREIEITGGEGGPAVRKEKERRASHDNDLDLCINIKGEDKWKDTMVEEARKDVRGEGMMKDTRLEEARKDIRCEETRKDTTAEEARLDFRGEETKKPPKVAQPQVARIGGRKRLTQEQKKLCYSEPEKLHKLMDVPTHKPSHSLGNEMESLLTDSELGDQGLVAARKKLFETRGRTMSASSLSKTTLKHLQQKALVAYMERKTGQKLTEPPQPCPPVPTERHSSVGRISDCDLRLHYGNSDSKMKIHRPLSAGRILDSSSSSIRYAQFGSSPGEHYQQSSLKERSLVSSSKAASFESLLDQPELSVPCRGRSKSTPHAPQDSFSTSDASSTDSSSTLKGEVTSVAALTQTVAVAAVIPNDRYRVVVPRGKSMEELGVAKVIRPTCLSRSSEQLHQLRGGSNGSRIHSSANPSFYQSRERGVVATPGEWTQRLPEYQEGRKEAMQTDIPHGREEGTSSVGSFPVGTGPLPDMAQFSSLTSTCTEAKPKGHLKESKCLSLYHLETPMPSSGKDSSPLEQNLVNQLGFSHEVALSDGVTTDPSLWPSSPAEEEEDGGEEEDEQSSSHTAMGMDTMHKLAPVSLPQSPRETPAAVEVNGTVGEKQEGEREEESQREGQMKDWEQEVASAGGSQTEEPARSTPPPQQQQQQQQHTLQTPWATLVEEVASVDQDLAHLLRPVPNRKTALMLMEQLLSEDTLLMEEHYKKKQVERASGLEGTHHQEELEGQKKEMEERGQRASVVEEHSDPSSCNREEVCSESQQDVAESLSEEDVIEKKRQLLACVEKRLSALGEQRSTLQSEEADNSKRGAVITALVAERCPPAEQERYALFIGDLERVVSLLLCLSARLARVQNALSSVDEHTDLEEKQSLDNRHHLLCKQRDDAKDLKDNLDRRERVVSTFLSKHLTDAELQDYRRFVQTKASLLIRLKDLDESQHLGEEQRDALLCSLPP